ncbi:unnamed protein product [Lymnaea stagnalis]|uniref:Rieske domain-containing protein n=1 Tax=Lymnaea stagnalis TaxID=6523 RepID=A0AAV2H9J9_LYMST
MGDTTDVDDNKRLFLPVNDLKFKDLLDWENKEERNHRLQIQKHLKAQGKAQQDSVFLNSADLHKKCFGNAITLNDESIALFRLGNKVYAIQALCPHAGGPLHMGDIEDFSPGEVCLKCPWHKWKFKVDTGAILSPTGQNITAKTFPVRVDNIGNIFIGFDSLGPSYFEMDS